jgi:type I restriction enzyme M protein
MDQRAHMLPKDYARPNLDKIMLGELIDLISGIAMHEERGSARDSLGRVYEYFLAGFAGSEGKRSGEFYTPRFVVRVLIEMLGPYQGRVYDPCCGSGGMFVQSDRFVPEHGGRIGDIALYGQESNYGCRVACMPSHRHAGARSVSGPLRLSL